MAIGLGLLLLVLRLRKQREITRAWSASSHRKMPRVAPPTPDGSEPRVLQ
ncbi:MAG TPA: hypothetical protein VIU61_29265 [Kofleriaceae bacterium]